MDSARGPFFTADEDDEFEAVAAVEYRVDGFIPDNDTRTGQSYILDHSYSHRSVSIMGPPPITGRFYYHQRFEDPRPRFLDSCALCKKPLGSNRDIFMYRGDTAFCSEECREEQMEMDEAQEKNRNLSSMRNKDKRKSSNTSPSKSQDCRLRSGTVAAG
ncbi:hypothetical protein SAY87_011557 [Trapa incisa]|uniref:FLZ-type domain-containing protein n=1 Tax=Trapa incisa TaxID=236973 RepID=A0AAN7GLB1_9MYRT|nr:hypothetical protein SAY87_011557 [Trapa incisa]